MKSSNKKPKLLIIGHARHGKDTVAGILNEMYGYTFKSSSQAAAEIFIYDALKDKYGYKSFEECYEDRMNHREEWYNMICEYNSEDPARLAKEIMKTNDIYVGMRSAREIESCVEQGVFDYIVAVYDERKPYEDESSIDDTIFEYTDVAIYNNGTLDDLKREVAFLIFYFEL